VIYDLRETKTLETGERQNSMLRLAEVRTHSLGRDQNWGSRNGNLGVASDKFDLHLALRPLFWLIDIHCCMYVVGWLLGVWVLEDGGFLNFFRYR
jgi:hypothetical protein